MSYRVYLAAVAERHVRAIAAWWAENRPNASSMFERELSAGLDRIAEVPRSGQPYRVRRRLETRRVLLAKTRHHVYYTVDDARSVVIVLAVWHSARGKAPRL